MDRRLASFVVALAALLTLIPSNTAAAGEPIAWSDTSRDVWVDGELRPDVRTLSASDPDRLALVLPGAAVLVIDTEAASVSTLDPAGLVDAEDRLHATSPPPVPAVDGIRATPLPDGWWITAAPRQILVGPHRGPAGPLDRAALWAAAPRWRLAADAWTPSPEAVEALRRVDRPTDLVVAFGTWCGDSRRSVPRLLAAVDAAANPHVSVELIGIRRGFEEPLDTVRDLRVTNVPTVIVRADGEEIGRFVERPVTDSVETDLAAILDGRELVADPRFDETDRLLVRGVYGLHVADGERVGSERFALFATEAGGHRLHAELVDPSGAIEVWQRLDADGRTAFVEITRRIEGRELSRTRLWVEDGEVRATTRGDATGIVRQTAALPDGGVVGLPVASALGTLWAEAGRPDTGRAFEALFWSGAGAPAAGRLEPGRFDPEGTESIGLPGGGTVEARRVGFVIGTKASTWWLHPDFGVPLRGVLDGARVELEDFEVP